MGVKYSRNDRIRFECWIFKEWDKLLIIVSYNLLKAEDL